VRSFTLVDGSFCLCVCNPTQTNLYLLGKMESHEPQSDPRLVAQLDSRTLNYAKNFTLDRTVAPVPVTVLNSLEERVQFVGSVETPFNMLMGLVAGDPDSIKVSTTKETILGVDGNEIALYVSQPFGRDSSSPTSAVLHIHGGAMAIFTTQTATNRVSVHFCHSLFLSFF
jgi:acetyl esterase